MSKDRLITEFHNVASHIIRQVDLETADQARQRFRQNRSNWGNLNARLFLGSDVRHTQNILASADPAIDKTLDKLAELEKVISRDPRQARGLMVLDRFVLPWRAREISAPYYPW